jgi:Signal peptidase, peptidase S26
VGEVLFSSLCTRMLEDGHTVRFQAPGTSMHPAIRDGEWVTVEPADLAAVRRGDVVLYRSPRGLTAHRVVRVVAGGGVPGRISVRGDNTGGLEEDVGFADVLGRITRVEHGRRPCDPAAIHARLLSVGWRAIAARKRAVHRLVARWRRVLEPKDMGRGARQGGSL